jgi:hypothetical protein
MMLMTKSYNHSNPTPLKKKKPHTHTPSMYLNELNRKQYPLRNSKKKYVHIITWIWADEI